MKVAGFPFLVLFAFCSFQAVGEDTGILEFKIEPAAPGSVVRGEEPGRGESESDLNRRLLESFGERPYGQPESEAEQARQRELHDRLTREAREELLFKLEARALRRSLDGNEEPEIDPALIPSRRFIELSQTLRNPQLERDRLEQMVQDGRLSPYDLYDAERGFFDPTRREFGFDPYHGPTYYGRPLPSHAIVQDLLTYQSYLRARRYAKYYE